MPLDTPNPKTLSLSYTNNASIFICLDLVSAISFCCPKNPLLCPENTLETAGLCRMVMGPPSLAQLRTIQTVGPLVTLKVMPYFLLLVGNLPWEIKARRRVWKQWDPGLKTEQQAGKRESQRKGNVTRSGGWRWEVSLLLSVPQARKLSQTELCVVRKVHFS